MRNLAILLLASAAVAQDDGVSLFYRGFWLEQAEGKLDEAAALYGRLLAEKPDAPEAPRALLGLVRIKVARSEDAKELVAELERRFPAAKEEIAAARRIAGEKANSFAEPPRDSDSGVERKMKILYRLGLSSLSEPDRTFLVDLGAVAHPMLAALLRSTEPNAVTQAAAVLLEQSTPEAYAVLAQALGDDSAVFRGVMVDRVKKLDVAAPALVEALEKLYGGAPPRLRVDVVAALAAMAGAGGDGRERAYAVLARALEDEDAGVRAAALAFGGAPDVYVDAFLRRLEAKDPALLDRYAALPFLADRAAFLKRVEALFDAYAIDWRQSWYPPHEAGALLFARRVEKELRKGNRDKGVYSVAYQCAGKSAKAAAHLLLAAIEIGDSRLVDNVRQGMGEREQAQYLAEEAGALRAAALAADDGGDAAKKVLSMLGLGPADLPAITEALRLRAGRGLPAFLLDDDALEALGPGNAGALVSHCRDGKEVARFLAAGRKFAEREDGGIDFFRQVVPRAGPESATTLRKVASDALAPILADRLLAADGTEWGWTVDGPEPNNIVAERHAGPYVWNQLRQLDKFTKAPALRARVAEHTDDPRLEVAQAAVSAAAAEKTEAGAAALRRALESKRPEVRGSALHALATSAPDAPALVRAFAARSGLTREDRSAVAGALGAKSPAMAAVAADLLRADPAWDLLWPAFHWMAPKEALELALSSPPTEGSLGVLVKVDDPRRIEIFRAVLKGADRAGIEVVLHAVYEQYLVELGEEALAQMRSPDEAIRGAAKLAIEKLKFYAEAKKAFEK